MTACPLVAHRLWVLPGLQEVDPDIRQSVWPLLLGVYPLSSSDAERQLLRSELDKSFRGLLTEAQVKAIFWANFAQLLA
jgi:hypothetical protein